MRLVEKLAQGSAHSWYEEVPAGHPADRTGVAVLSDLAIPSDAAACRCAPVGGSAGFPGSAVGQGAAGSSRSRPVTISGRITTRWLSSAGNHGVRASR